jgi:two-component system, NtrC family, sensor kinase
MPTGKLRILVVDDDGPLRRVLHRLLGVRYEVMDVATAEEALAIIEGGARFDAILCDLHLGGMSGAEFRARVEQVDSGQARRCLIHTGRAETPWEAEFLADADEEARLVIKPAPVAEFVDAFEHIVERHGRA